MYKISELIGKEAITLSDAVKEGIVFNACFDRALNRCKFFVLLTADEEKKWVEYKNVLSYGGDAFVISAAADILDDEPAGAVSPSPINLSAFNQDGMCLGIIKDIVMDGAEVTAFVTDKGEIPAGLMLSRSNEILVFNDSGKPVKIKKSVKSAASAVDNEAEKPKKAQKDSAEKPAAEPAKSDSQKEEAVKTPQKIAQDKTAVYHSPYEEKGRGGQYSFLLGKRLQRSLYDAAGKVIAHENELISDKTIGRAKENGKLVALALHSL